MKYKKQDLIKIFMILMSTVLLYLSITELRIALSGSQAAAQTVPCTFPTPSIQPSATPSASPNPSPTSIPTPLPISTIFLTEFMACPASGNEWIELYNASNTTIIVSGWQVIDEASNKKTISGSIAPLSFSTFQWSGSLLNNTGDSFKVVTDTGLTIGEATYDSCSSGVSFVYEDGEWVGALESPEKQTSISEHSISTATASAANHDRLEVLASAVSAESNVLPTQSVSEPEAPQYQLPSLHTTLPNYSNNLVETKLPTQQSKPNTASAISVILGGLLQLLPGSYALYEKFFKQYT